MAIIGPGSVQEQEVRPDPTLKGASQYEVVRVFNPLSDDFAIQVAQSRPVDLPIQVKDPATQGQTSLSASDITRTYGVGLKNTDHASNQSKRHILNRAVIKSGQSMNFPGDVAQVAVKQLVDEIMQREGQTKFLADPVRRKAVEDRVVIARGSMEDLMNNSLQTVEQQLSEAIEKSNEVQNEEAFPALNTERGNEAQPLESVPESDKRQPGRPKKTS